MAPTQPDFTITDAAPGGEDPFETLSGILGAFNDAHGAPWEAVPLWLFARDNGGKVIGGVRGRTGWSWAFLDTLAVADSHRGQGLGRALLAEAEAIAKTRGCIGIHLWTVSFQAPDFYRRLGYTEFGTLPDHPPGRSSHWFMKRF